MAASWRGAAGYARQIPLVTEKSPCKRDNGTVARRRFGFGNVRVRAMIQG